MRKLSLLLLLFLISSMAYCQVGVGTDTPHNSAALHVESTTLGFLPPRMNSAQS